jgi:peptidoglycan/xylan/chitin deacetylase (PgdA/CDA1 family)
MKLHQEKASFTLTTPRCDMDNQIVKKKVGVKLKIAEIIANLTQVSFIKQILLKIGKNECIIFMLHRFDVSGFRESGVDGHDPEFLEKCIVDLKNDGHNIISIDEAFEAVRENRVISNAVVFTMDDGFFDHALIAEKVFAKHHVPVTIFLVTDFVDGKLWLVDSKLAYIVENTEFNSCSLSFQNERFEAQTKKNLKRQLVWYAKTLTLDVQDEFVLEMSKQLGVDVPSQAPECFRALTWEDARRLEKRGISFGAHTSQHPTLSIESDEVSKLQIGHSIERLRKELNRPSQIFCYPTGRYQDFSQREFQYAEEFGMFGAVSAEPGYFSMKKQNNSRFLVVNRFSWPQKMIDFRQFVLYIEYLKRGIK